VISVARRESKSHLKGEGKKIRTAQVRKWKRATQRTQTTSTRKEKHISRLTPADTDKEAQPLMANGA